MTLFIWLLRKFSNVLLKIFDSITGTCRPDSLPQHHQNVGRWQWKLVSNSTWSLALHWHPLLNWKVFWSVWLIQSRWRFCDNCHLRRWFWWNKFIARLLYRPNISGENTQRALYVPMGLLSFKIPLHVSLWVAVDNIVVLIGQKSKG